MSQRIDTVDRNNNHKPFLSRHLDSRITAFTKHICMNYSSDFFPLTTQYIPCFKHFCHFNFWNIIILWKQILATLWEKQQQQHQSHIITVLILFLSINYRNKQISITFHRDPCGIPVHIRIFHTRTASSQKWQKERTNGEDERNFQ